MAADEQQVLRDEWARANRGSVRRSLRGGGIWLAVAGGFVAGALTLAALYMLYSSRVEARHEAFERRDRGEYAFVERDEPVFGLGNLLPPVVVTFAVASFLRRRLGA